MPKSSEQKSPFTKPIPLKKVSRRLTKGTHGCTQGCWAREVYILRASMFVRGGSFSFGIVEAMTQHSMTLP